MTSRTRSPLFVPKYQHVAFWVMGRIDEGHYGPGDKIPTIRELCEQFDVGDVTVKSALKYLSDRGLIRTVVGSGTYVCKPRPAADTQTVGFIKIGVRFASIYTYGIDLVQQELQTQDLSVLYSVIGVDDEQQAEAAVRRLVDRHANPLIVFPSHGTPLNQSPLYPILSGWGGPLLVLESQADQHDYVTSNIEQSTYDLTNYLLELGHRRICLATQFHRKVTGFRRALRRFQEPGLQHWVVDEIGETDEASHDLGQRVLELSPRPTALIAGDDHAAAVLVHHFQSHGLQVPGDISVVGFNDDPQQGASSPVALTTVRHPAAEVAQEVGRWVKRPAGSNARYRREVTGALIVRDSTAPPPDDD